MEARCHAINLLDLPLCLLESICLHLPLRERARAALVCKRTRQLCNGSVALWSNVDEYFQAERLENFSRWLQLTDRKVCTLRLFADLDAQAVLVQPSVSLGHAISAISATADSLEELDLHIEGALSNLSMLLQMTRLQKARISAHHITVPASLHGLVRLQKLALLSRAELDMCPPLAPGSLWQGDLPVWLPPALVKLGLHGPGDGLPGGLGKATSLQALAVHGRSLRGRELTSLAALTGLVELQLTRCGMSSPPPELSALSQLRALYLDQNPIGYMEPASWAPLEPLRHLAFLSLSRCALPALPAEVTIKTSLRALHFEGNRMGTLPRGPYLAQLQELAVDWDVLFLSHHELKQHATQLSFLIVGGAHQSRVDAAGTGAADRAERVGRVLDSLAAMPALTQFTDVVPSNDMEEEEEEFGLRADVALCLLRLGKRCPHLDLDVCEGDTFGWSMEDVA